MSVIINPDGTITPIQNVQSLTVTITDRSGTIAAGGIAQQLAPANGTRRGLRIMNISSGDLWINDKGMLATPSQPSFKIPANSMYENPINGVSGAILSVFGSATGQAFEACEW